MTIQAQVFAPECACDMPRAAQQLSLERMLASDGSGYINSFRARLTAGGRPLAGQEVEFRFNTYWNEDGSVNTTAQEDAPDKGLVCTDAGRLGCCFGSALQRHRRHTPGLANVDVVCHGSQDARLHRPR